MNNLWDSLSHNFQLLLAVPGKMLSVEGLSQGAAFALIDYINRMFGTQVVTSLSRLPGGQFLVAIYGGSITNANILYGLSAHGIK